MFSADYRHFFTVFAADFDQTKISTKQICCHDYYTLHLVMVTTYGVTHNDNYNIIQNEVTMDDLFVE